MEYIDITPVISPRIAVFPGDVAFRRQVAMDCCHGDHLTLSSIETTVHVGAHADAPSHYHADGVAIGERSLQPYLGQCQVLHIEAERGARITPAHIADKTITARRVLFGTGSFPDPDHWVSDFNSLSPSLIEFLAERGVVLVGIDTPSVDPETSKVLESHQAIYRHDMAILEGLVLSHVPEGEYFLIALPLKIEDADASPVRAVLLPEPPR